MSGSVLVKSPVISQGWDITVTAPYVWTIPTGFYDGTEVLTANGGWWVPIDDLYPSQNIHWILSPMIRVSSNWETTDWYAIYEVWWKIYYLATIAIWNDSWTRSITCVSSVGIEEWGVFTNKVVQRWWSVSFTWTWVAPVFYINWTDIHLWHPTDFAPRSSNGAIWRYVTFDTTTDTFTNSVIWPSNNRHIVWLNTFWSVDNISSVNAYPWWTLLTNSITYLWDTYSSNFIWDDTVTNPWSSPVARTIWWIHVAIKS